MEETYEMPLDNLLHELEERGIDTSKLNLIEFEHRRMATTRNYWPNRQTYSPPRKTIEG